MLRLLDRFLCALFDAADRAAPALRLSTLALTQPPTKVYSSDNNDCEEET